MEMNTRLQVEHPVTEMIAGVDLVEWQLRVAAGEPLPMTQDELYIDGWAMEARLYAENPETGFLPSIGLIEALHLPDNIRVDSGITSGGEISPYYDPMVAKLISVGETRDDARALLAEACDSVSTWPVHNNAGFLSTLLRTDEFAEASVTTGFIDANMDRLTKRPAPSAGGLAVAGRYLTEAEHDPKPSTQAWAGCSGFRLNGEPDLQAWFAVDGDVAEVTLDAPQTVQNNLISADGQVILFERGWPYEITRPVYDADDAATGGDGALTSPMPGKVIAVLVAEGDAVTAGQKLVTLEAMKMEHSLTAPFDGRVETVGVSVGDQVTEGSVLARIAPLNDQD